MGAEVRAAMFFAGLILLIPHRIGMSRVNYIIKRYNLPISRAGLLLYKYHNNIELSLLIGTLAGNIIVWSIGARLNKTGSGAPDAEEKDTLKLTLKCFMLIFLFFMLLSSIIMFIIYISGGDFGHLNAFYFSLIFLTLVDGFANAFAFALNAAYSSLLAAGIPLSGFLVTMLHYTYKFFYDIFNRDDFDYNVLFIQLLSNAFILFITFILWCLFDESKASPSSFDLSTLFESNTNDSHYGDWSPIGMLAISLGTVYAFYPSIAPYSIIDFQYASIIELWILIISAIIPLTFAILDLCTHYIPTLPYALGSSGEIKVVWQSDTNFPNTSSSASCTYSSNTSGKKKYPGVTKNWNHKSSEFYWCWQLVWICAIFYILCIQIFMSMLHYPHCILSCFFNNHPYATSFISILFNTLREVMQALGFSGAGKQVKQTAPSIAADQYHCKSTITGGHNTGCPNDGKSQWQSVDKWSTAVNDSGQKTVNGSIASLNKLITLFVMMFCVFTGDGYLQHYRRCCRDCWPTTGYNKYQSFFYWLHFGFKGIRVISSSS